MSDENRYKEVQSDRWEEMSVTDLYEQLSILQSRAAVAASMNNLPMLKQIQKGIDQCNEIIAKKTGGDNTVII